MSFHLKYRPNNFEEFLGNNANVVSLKKIIKKEDHPHCYLFYGIRGGGKTTLARILSKEFDCGENIYEVNGSDNRGIETARQIIEQSQFKCLDGKNKCYILDECHRMTIDMQSALLKILEDTPRNVYFFLCTTEPEKLLKTVRDRCFTFKVEKLYNEEMIKLLKGIRKKEKGTCSDDTLDRIYKKSESNRQALIMLEKTLTVEDDSEARKIIDEFKESIESIELCRALFKDWRTVVKVLNKLDESEDIEKIRRMILGYYNKVLLNPASNSSSLKKASLIIKSFKNNFFDSGKAGLSQACYQSFFIS